MKLTHFIFGILFLVIVTGCEDAIDIDSLYDKQQMVVDAWLTNEAKEQNIKLTYTQDYYDNSAPSTVDGAEVLLISGIDTFVFVEEGFGNYTYDGERVFGDVGDTLELTIRHEGKSIAASNVISRVPTIDSIYTFEEDDEPGIRGGKYAELFVDDFIGQGDTYWIRAFRNDTLLNRPQEQVLIYDSGFDSGTSLDGTTFIRPLRLGINSLDDELFAVPLNNGDKLNVELWSISNSAFRFLQTVVEQATNGDNTIFTLPVANAFGNIHSDCDEEILGFFNVSAVSSIEKIIE